VCYYVNIAYLISIEKGILLTQDSVFLNQLDLKIQKIKALLFM